MKPNEKIAGGLPIPRNLNFFIKMTHCGARNGRALYKDDDGFYYQWDSCHGEWEKFSKHGRHLGAISPDGSKMTKDAIKTRKIEI